MLVEGILTLNFAPHFGEIEFGGLEEKTVRPTIFLSLSPSPS